MAEYYADNDIVTIAMCCRWHHGICRWTVSDPDAFPAWDPSHPTVSIPVLRPPQGFYKKVVILHHEKFYSNDSINEKNTYAAVVKRCEYPDLFA